MPEDLSRHSLQFTVNGLERRLVVTADERLIDVLRNRLGLTSVKEGCGTGDCGSCVVEADGLTVNSCLMLAMQARGKRVLTLEGLVQDERLHPLQDAFASFGATSCGFCTPGMIITAKNLLDRKRKPTEREIREALRGNLCRCTGYMKIVEAVKAASKAGGHR